MQHGTGVEVQALGPEFPEPAQTVSLGGVGPGANILLQKETCTH